jgi:hypothetical protein
MSIRNLAIALGLGLVATTAHADVVLDWNETLLDAIRVDRTAPPTAGRAMAITQVAVYDAVVGVLGGYEPYHVHRPGNTPSPPVSAEAAAAAAAHQALVALFPAQQASFDAALDASLAAIPDGVAESGGVAWGSDVAEQILALRADDHSGDTVTPGFPTGAFWWAPTPPAFAGPVLPQWPYVTPWALSSGSQLRGLAPPTPTSAEYTASFREVRRLGRADSPFRTPEQTQIALFWADGPGTATPPGHWHVIAQGLSAERHLSLLENARLFALLALTSADAAIVSWDHKYIFNVWRPVTGIRMADQDGNPDTVADPTWSSLITTPPFPAYTSGHSTFSGAAARLLGLFFGTDAISFSTTSDALPGVTRSFSRLSQAAAEAGQSRIYGGIHWQFDNQLGLGTGRALAEQVFHNFGQPVGAPSTCAPGPSTLCLGVGGRFRVTVDWRTPTASGVGNGNAIDDNSGSFWFFEEDNTELTLKVLDACDEFERYWVFASGLTDVEVTLRVTDTEHGVTRVYFNPQGKAFDPVQDTQAFATCP